MSSVYLKGVDASCWVWQALWEERKKLQKRQKQREENAHKWWKDAASAVKPIQFRILDAVLFDGFSSIPALGIFTSRQGELMRRTNTSLELSIVRGRMAQVALGVFGSGGNGTQSHSTPIAIAHLADGSTKEVSGGLEWDKFISSGVRNGNLKALTAWATPITEPAEKGSTAMRMRHSYRVITEGSQFGKIKTRTDKVMAKSAVGVAYGKTTSADIVLVPSRDATTNQSLDMMTVQLVKLIEGDGFKVMHLVTDYVVQTDRTKKSTYKPVDISDLYDKRKHSNHKNNGGGDDDGVAPKEDLIGRHISGESTVWMEKVIVIDLKYTESSASSSTNKNSSNNYKTDIDGSDEMNLQLAAPHLVKGDAMRRKCSGDFCGFDPLGGEGDGVIGIEQDFETNVAPAVINKVVTFRSIECARNEACELVLRVKDMVKESLGTLRSLSNDEVEHELVGCFKEKGWNKSLSRWWLSNKANLPIKRNDVTETPMNESPNKQEEENDDHSTPVEEGEEGASRVVPEHQEATKALLITSPVTLTEVWWPGRLVDINWASVGKIPFVSIWIEDGDGSGLSAQIVARTPNTGKFVCVLPATIAAAVADHYEQNLSGKRSSNLKSTPAKKGGSNGRGMSAVGGGGTCGWGFKVRICDAHDPAVEAYSPIVVIVKSESEVLEEDKIAKPKERLDFESRVACRRVMEWRAQLEVKQSLHSQSHISASTKSSSSITTTTYQQTIPEKTKKVHAENLTLVPMLCKFDLNEMNLESNGRALHHRYTEMKVCDTCYRVYKNLDEKRRAWDEKEEKETKKQRTRQKLVKEHVRREFKEHGASVGSMAPLPVLAAAQSNQQRAVSERLARPKPVVEERSVKTQGDRRDNLPKINNHIGEVEQGSEATSTMIANKTSGVYAEPVWGQLKDGTYGTQGVESKSGFVKHIEEKANRVRAEAEATEAKIKHNFLNDGSDNRKEEESKKKKNQKKLKQVTQGKVIYQDESGVIVREASSSSSSSSSLAPPPSLLITPSMNASVLKPSEVLSQHPGSQIMDGLLGKNRRENDELKIQESMNKIQSKINQMPSKSTTLSENLNCGSELEGKVLPKRKKLKVPVIKPAQPRSFYDRFSHKYQRELEEEKKQRELLVKQTESIGLSLTEDQIDAIFENKQKEENDKKIQIQLEHKKLKKVNKEKKIEAKYQKLNSEFLKLQSDDSDRLQSKGINKKQFNHKKSIIPSSKKKIIQKQPKLVPEAFQISQHDEKEEEDDDETGDEMGDDFDVGYGEDGGLSSLQRAYAIERYDRQRQKQLHQNKAKFDEDDEEEEDDDDEDDIVYRCGDQSYDDLDEEKRLQEFQEECHFREMNKKTNQRVEINHLKKHKTKQQDLVKNTKKPTLTTKNSMMTSADRKHRRQVSSSSTTNKTEKTPIRTRKTVSKNKTKHVNSNREQKQQELEAEVALAANEIDKLKHLGGDQEKSPAKLVAMLEKLTAEAKLLESTPQDHKVPPISPKAVLSSSPQNKQRQNKCQHCGLLPNTRRCLDCSVIGCTACWAHIHRGEKHRFELIGDAKSQVASMLDEASMFADELHLKQTRPKEIAEQNLEQTLRTIHHKANTAHKAKQEDFANMTENNAYNSTMYSKTMRSSEDVGEHDASKLSTPSQEKSIDSVSQSVKAAEVSQRSIFRKAAVPTPSLATKALITNTVTNSMQKMQPPPITIDESKPRYSPVHVVTKQSSGHSKNGSEEDDDDDDDEGIMPLPTSVASPYDDSFESERDEDDEDNEEDELEEEKEYEDEESQNESIKATTLDIEEDIVASVEEPRVPGPSTVESVESLSTSMKRLDTGDLNWRKELNSVATQHIKERDELKQTIEKEASRQGDSLMLRRMQRKKSMNQTSISHFTKPIINTKMNNNMSKLPSNDRRSPVNITTQAENQFSPKSSFGISQEQKASPTRSHLQPTIAPQRPSSPPLPSSALTPGGSNGYMRSGGASSEWLKREWSQAQEDSASQIAALEDEAYRQQKATLERRVISAQGKGSVSRLGVHVVRNPISSPSHDYDQEVSDGEQAVSDEIVYEQEYGQEYNEQGRYVEEEEEEHEYHSKSQAPTHMPPGSPPGSPPDSPNGSGDDGY